MSVVHVRKVSVASHNSLYIREPTWGRNPTDVVTVRKASAISHSSLFIGDLTQERKKAYGYDKCEKISPLSLASFYPKTFIQRKNLRDAMIVGKPSSEI